MPHWRKSTWAFIIWTGLIAIWLVSGVSNASQGCAASAYQEACNAGATIGATIILFIWFLVAVPLSVIWYATKPKNRQCPTCGYEVKKGFTTCAHCGHDFTLKPA